MMNLSIFGVLTNGNIIAICAFSIVGLALAYFTFASAREWGTLFYLSQHGILIDAKITDVTINSTGRGTNHVVEYSYYVGDTFYRGKQQISRKHYKQFQQQDYVIIRYVPTKPNWSRLAETDFDNTYRNITSYVAFAGCLAFAPFIALWAISLVGTYIYLLLSMKGKKKKRLES